MSLSINELKQVMLDSTYNQVVPGQPLIDLGNAISKYIITHALLTFTWVAVNTVPNYDTETLQTTGEILTCPINLTPSMAIVPVTGLIWLATEIVNGIRLGLFNITAPGWTTGPELLSDCPDFTLTIDVINLQNSGGSCEDMRESSYNQLATQIVNQIIAYHPITPIQGMHGTYSGATTVCTIS